MVESRQEQRLPLCDADAQEAATDGHENAFSEQ
jgi:hypothetical protein